MDYRKSMSYIYWIYAITYKHIELRERGFFQRVEVIMNKRVNDKRREEKSQRNKFNRKKRI